MEMPKPNDGNRKLERLVGTWTGQETMHPSPYAPGGTYTGKVRNARALDGFAVIQDYDQEKDGKVGFRGHGIFRFDQASGKYQMTWFDTFGVGASHMEGTFEGDVLKLEMKASQGLVRATWNLSKKDEYGYLMEVSGDGSKWSPFIEATYHRT